MSLLSDLLNLNLSDTTDKVIAEYICTGQAPGVDSEVILYSRLQQFMLWKPKYIELEPGRCRRTDGKKWRCSRDVPDKKYCMQHMHRGAKRHAVASQTIPVPNASTT